MSIIPPGLDVIKKRPERKALSLPGKPILGHPQLEKFAILTASGFLSRMTAFFLTPIAFCVGLICRAMVLGLSNHCILELAV